MISLSFAVAASLSFSIIFRLGGGSSESDAFCDLELESRGMRRVVDCSIVSAQFNDSFVFHDSSWAHEFEAVVATKIIVAELDTTAEPPHRLAQPFELFCTF
jgi:hypothetical protein